MPHACAAGTQRLGRPGLAMGVRRRSRRRSARSPRSTEPILAGAEVDCRREASDQSPQQARMAASGAHLVAHLQDAPFLLIPCLQGRVDRSSSAMSATFWASVMPATWSLCLALRSRGLGTCWTTLHLFGNGERAAAEVLNIPYDDYSQVGMFPIAYTKGVDFKPARRLEPRSR